MLMDLNSAGLRFFFEIRIFLNMDISLVYIDPPKCRLCTLEAHLKEKPSVAVWKERQQIVALSQVKVVEIDVILSGVYYTGKEIEISIKIQRKIPLKSVRFRTVMSIRKFVVGTP